MPRHTAPPPHPLSRRRQGVSKTRGHWAEGLGFAASGIQLRESPPQKKHPIRGEAKHPTLFSRNIFRTLGGRPSSFCGKPCLAYTYTVRGTFCSVAIILLDNTDMLFGDGLFIEGERDFYSGRVFETTDAFWFQIKKIN